MIFSVIVPFLNEERRIERCIRSLLDQSFARGEYEIIFIDNDSSDASVQIVRRYPSINLLYEKRRDPYLARNRGIEAARGKYLAFTDADCVVSPQWLEELHALLQTAEIVLGRLRYPSPTPALLKAYEHYYHTKMTYLLQTRNTECYYGHAGNMAVKASVFQSVGLFPPLPIVGDTDVIHKLLRHDKQAAIAYAPQAEVIHTEVRRYRHCLYKLFECGQYSETYSQAASYRPLRFAERSRVFATCIEDGRSDPRMIATLTGTLVMGLISFQAGRWTRRLQARFGHAIMSR